MMAAAASPLARARGLRQRSGSSRSGGCGPAPGARWRCGTRVRRGAQTKAALQRVTPRAAAGGAAVRRGGGWSAPAAVEVVVAALLPTPLSPQRTCPLWVAAAAVAVLKGAPCAAAPRAAVAAAAKAAAVATLHALATAARRAAWWRAGEVGRTQSLLRGLPCPPAVPSGSTQPLERARRPRRQAEKHGGVVVRPALSAAKAAAAGLAVAATVAARVTWAVAAAVAVMVGVELPPTRLARGADRLRGSPAGGSVGAPRGAALSAAVDACAGGSGVDVGGTAKSATAPAPPSGVGRELSRGGGGGGRGDSEAAAAPSTSGQAA